MATSFECDPVLAGQVSGELARIRADLGSGAGVFDTATGATGSRPVEDALRHFWSDSCDSRTNLDKLLERASGLLRALADGETAADRSLAEALTPPSSGPGSRPAAAPVAPVVPIPGVR